MKFLYVVPGPPRRSIKGPRRFHFTGGAKFRPRSRTLCGRRIAPHFIVRGENSILSSDFVRGVLPLCNNCRRVRRVDERKGGQ